MRRAAWTLAGLVALLAVLVVGVAGMAATATGFRWLAAAATALAGERLRIDGVEGHLGAPLSIRRLRLATATQRVEIDGLRLEWQPRALWQRRLDIDLLAARAVRVTLLDKDAAPPQLPSSLRLPLDLRIRAIDLVRLEIVDAGEPLVLRELRAGVDGVGDRYRLTLLHLITPWAEVDGTLALDKDAPFALQGAFAAAADNPLPLLARLDLRGDLAAPAFDLEAEAGTMRFLARGAAAPFAPVKLTRLLVAGEGIDPRRFAAAAPAAELAFSGVFEGRPGERLFGTFSLANRIAGRLDEGRLPLVGLTGAVLGDATRADVSDLAVDLGAAGRLDGSGGWRDGRFSLELASLRLDLAGLHRDLAATRLQTTLRLAGDAARQTLDGSFAERWGQGGFSLVHADAALRLASLDFRGEAGRLAAAGVLALDAGRAFDFSFDASRINPARFGNFPAARLNARGTARGALAPAPRVTAEFSLPAGTLEGRPVRGGGRLRYAEQHLAEIDVDLDFAGNRAQFEGAYGRAGDRLTWVVDAPALARLRLGLAGRLQSRGSVGGDPAAPQIDARLAASGLRLPGDIAAESLDIELTLQAAARGVFEGRLAARDLRVGGQRLTAANARLAGRRDAHTLTLDAAMTARRLRARLAGGLDASQVWRGRLTEAEVQGDWPARLLAPATLQLSRTRQTVEQLALTLAQGRVEVARFEHDDGRLASRGTLENLPLAPLLALLEPAPPLTSTLRLDGAWNLRLDPALHGELRLRRRSGDLRVTDPGIDLGLTTLALEMSAAANRVDATLDLATREAGVVHASGAATLLRDERGLSLPRTAPITWRARVDVPDLRLARAFLPLGVRLDARLAAQLAGSGSLATPRIDGSVDADRIRFAIPEQGVAITDGRLALVLADDRVRVRQGELQGERGRIVVSGEAQLKNPQAGLTLTFEQFAATNRSDRRVVVSGVTRLKLDPRRLELAGELTADSARLEMPEAGKPELSSDVVVVGRPPPQTPAAQRLPLALDLRLGLGERFYFKGAGLDVRLGGRLHVFTAGTALRGEGRIQVEDGRYAAYGQSLDIERGVLSFVGPIDNPGLDVLAVRKTPTVTAGVQVRGTVQRPLVTLYSDPPLPDTEKLAWLVLGRGLGDGGQEEFALLQLAAGALLSQAESVNMQARLAETLRIDSFDVRGGEGEDLATTVVSVGKRLSSRATLSYEQSLDGLSQVVKVLYQLTPRVRLEAQAGQPSSFDAFYTLEYD